VQISRGWRRPGAQITTTPPSASGTNSRYIMFRYTAFSDTKAENKAAFLMYPFIFLRTTRHER
jgi:Tfp pilus assembly protein PilX